MPSDIRRIVRDDGIVVLSLRGGWSEAAIQQIAADAFDELSINDGNWGDLRPLIPFADKIKHLRVTSGAMSFKGIESLHKLESVELDNAPSPPCDLTALRNLRYCYLKWHKRYAKDFFALPKLRDVTLLGYTEENCRDISIASKLSSLEITQGGLQSLSGLEEIKELSELSLSYLRGLTDVTQIRSMLKLEILHIEKCPKVEDVSNIPKLVHLRELFVDCGGPGFEDVDWLLRFKDLVDLLIAVPVKSPNWQLIASLPNLRNAVVNTHPGYSVPDSEVLAQLRRSGREIRDFIRAGTKKFPGFKFALGSR